MKAASRRGMCALLVVLFLLGQAPVLAEDAERPVVRISVRDYGDIYAELYPEYAPITVENFLNLVQGQFYDGLTFHRIITGFMIQGGDPRGNGTGGSDQTIKGEFSQNGVDNPLKHTRGVLSMARSADMNSASSQFFIMHADASHLDGAYAAFGRVLCGMPVVDRLCLTPVQDKNGTVLKANQPVIESIRIVDRAEAEAAQKAETENGRAGTVYHDPFSPLSFSVPAGWNRTAYPGACIAQFQSDAGQQLLVNSLDVWARYSAQLTQLGYSRETMDTAAALQLGLLTLDPSQYASETHSGAAFYTASRTGETAVMTVYIGMHQGCIYQFLFSAAPEAPLQAEAAALLDGLTFE